MKNSQIYVNYKKIKLLCILLARLVERALAASPKARAVITALFPLPLLPTRKLMFGPNSIYMFEWHMKFLKRTEIILPHRLNGFFAVSPCYKNKH